MAIHKSILSTNWWLGHIDINIDSGCHSTAEVNIFSKVNPTINKLVLSYLSISHFCEGKAFLFGEIKLLFCILKCQCFHLKMGVFNKWWHSIRLIKSKQRFKNGCGTKTCTPYICSRFYEVAWSCTLTSLMRYEYHEVLRLRKMTLKTCFYPKFQIHHKTTSKVDVDPQSFVSYQA